MGNHGGTRRVPGGRARATRAGATSPRSAGPPKSPVTAAAERALAAAFPQARVDLGAMDPALAAEVADELGRLAGAYPEVAARVRFLGSDRAPAWRRMGGSASEEWSLASASSMSGEYLVLSARHWATRAALDAALARQAASDEARPFVGGGTVRATVAHEFGHLVYAYVRTYSQAGYMATRDLVRVPEDEARAVSPYAASRDPELFAEAFAAALHGDPAVRALPYVQRQAAWVADWMRRIRSGEASPTDQ